MRCDYYLLDVFTQDPLTGNQLAVVLSKQPINDDIKLAVAREFGFSETVFYEIKENQYYHEISIFTPTMELPFAGHPTIGTAVILKILGLTDENVNEIEIKEKIGNVKVNVELLKPGLGYASFTYPIIPTVTEPQVSNTQFAEILGLSERKVGSCQGYVSQQICAGVNFNYIPIESKEDLYKCKFNHEAWLNYLSSQENNNVYAFTQCTSSTNQHELVFHSRMFAPSMGQTEDAATGAAAGGLVSYLHHFSGYSNNIKATILQGIAIQRPSKLQIQSYCENGKLTGISVGGNAVLVGSGSLNLPLG